MKNIFRAVIIAFCLLFNTHLLVGNNTKSDIDHILIINAYAEANPWSNSLINPIIGMAGQNSHVGAISMHLKMLTLDNMQDLSKLKESIIQQLPSQKPKLIVFIGSPSFILCNELDQQWPGIPMLLCGERDYTGPEELIAQGLALAPEQRIPVSKLHEKYNLTFMEPRIYIKESLQLMKQLIPKMNKLIYIGDKTYICQQNHYDISKVVKENYPYLKYKFLSAQNISTDSLFTILNSQDQQTTGILFTSWFRKKDYTDNLVMTTNSHRIIATSSMPLFSLRTVGIQEEGGIVGGYVYDEKKYIDQLLSNINKILNGKQARDIPFYQKDSGSPVFNYQSLLQRNLDPSLCPSNSTFYNAPLGFWRQYEYIIIGIVCLTILLLLLFQNLRVQALMKLKRIQQKEIETIGRYYNLINNMPIIYILEELITDENGQIVETKFADVN